MFVKHLNYKFFNCLHLKLQIRNVATHRKGYFELLQLSGRNLSSFCTYLRPSQFNFPVNEVKNKNSKNKPRPSRGINYKCLRRYLLKGMKNLSIKIIFRLSNKERRKSKQKCLEARRGRNHPAYAIMWCDLICLQAISSEHYT